MPLTAESILQGALEMIDAEGLESLTMRALATRLGVGTMSLYGHVANKDELILAVINMVVAEMALPNGDSPPWDALRIVTREFRRVALEHPNMVPLVVQQPPTGLSGLRTLEAALDALRRAGIPPSHAATAYRLMASFAIGFVSLECGGFFRPVDPTAGPHIGPADIAKLPRIIESTPYLAEWDADNEFEQGMDELIGVLAGWASSLSSPTEVVEGDRRRGGDVEGVDAPAHRDLDQAVGRP